MDPHRRLALTLVLALGACGGGDHFKPRAELLDPATCMQCHEDHYREWSGSMHAYASDDPVFRAMNARGQRETMGMLGDFCVKCHAPMAVAEGATTDGLNLDTVPQELRGVTCFFCHTVDSVDGTHNNPLHLADEIAMRGEYDNPVTSNAHPSTYSALHDRDKPESAAMCGSCHDIVTVPGGAHIEETYAEWQASVFSTAAGATCGQCHMDQSANPTPIAGGPDVSGVFARRTHSHRFPAVDTALTPFPEMTEQRQAVQAFLDSSLQSALCVIDVDGQPALRVVVDNVAAGHGFPSGAAQDRRVWFEVSAEKLGVPFYQSGADLAAPDPDLWMLRDCMFDGQGNEVSMFWEAVTNDGAELPAQITFDMTNPDFYKNHIVKNFPAGSTVTDVLPDAPDRVTLKIHVQPVGRDVLDELVASGDLEQSIVDAMPTLDLDLGDGPTLVWTAATADQQYVENGDRLATCVTMTNLNLAADKVPGVSKSVCTPP